MEVAGTVPRLEVPGVWAEDIWGEAVSTLALTDLPQAEVCLEECYSCRPESSSQPEELTEAEKLTEPEEVLEWSLRLDY